MTGQNHEPFLRLVAQAYYDTFREDIHNICFIFPNRRSGSFFLKELSAIAPSPILSPKITTITDFLTDITGEIEASKIELLFILYSKYRALMGDSADDFDKFSYWGDIILNDFNDIDKYLTDPQKIFINISDYKEISSNFLTDEQIAVISNFWGEDNWQPPTNDKEHFWKNSEIYGESDASRKFAEIWSKLYELYSLFNCELESQHLSYSGKMYRNATMRIKQMDIDQFEYNQYVFVGFNVLSESEKRIFKYMDDKGIADFYWDFNSPALSDDRNKASLFLKKNIKMFRSKLSLNETKIDKFPPIHVIGSPSNIGQVKYIPKILKRLIDTGAISDTDNAINTAIVLPDENLFLPLLDSIPDEISNVNITMGYPLRLSAIASFISLIAKLHKQARKSDNEYAYFKEDISDILSHPFIKAISYDEANKVVEYIFKRNLFYISYEQIKSIAPNLADLFTPLNTRKSTQELVIYITDLIEYVTHKLINSDFIQKDSVEAGFIAQYVELLNQLASTILKYNVDMNDNTFFYLIGRMLSSASIAFEGEPMKGLQIMGILETRCLDFDNIILLSMNERVFPRKHYSRSFIPNGIRRAFKMATVEYQDCMYAYYFFRMISRAKHIYMLYDARTQAIGSGEPSRYIEQIKVLYPESGINQQIANFSVTVPKKIEINVIKNQRILNILEKYRDPNSGYYLSASAINQYINCPLSFYLEKVENIRIADEITEFMNASTLGTIVHSVMKQLYESIAINNQNNTISTNDIAQLLKKDKYIASIIARTINKEYFKISDDELLATGETQLIKDAIIYFVKGILTHDQRLGTFNLVLTEEEEKLSWDIQNSQDKHIQINFKQYIDRVDEIEINGSKTLRIIDYKTGKDKTSARDVNMMFDAKSADRRKAMLQLMIYCNVFSAHKNIDRQIIPAIYKIRNIEESGFKIGKNNITDYRSINTEFLDKIYDVVDSIFDANIPFAQALNSQHCEYCKFSAFCHR